MSKNKPYTLSSDYSLLPILFGIFLGVTAICAEFFLKISPPNSYGICIICHTMDTINWIINKIFNTSYIVQPPSLNLPLVTSFAVLAGAIIAAKKNKEFRFKTVSNPIFKFFLGFIVMSFSLVAMGCPIRITLLTTYGDGMAIFSFIGLFIGITLGTLILKKGSSYR